MFGGVFFEKTDGGVFWLECPTGEIAWVADSAETFQSYLSGPRDDAWYEHIDVWFLTEFVQKLHDAGKRPGPGQCYGFTILPVFREGRYEVGNILVLSARKWLTFAASLHEQIRDVPDGTKVQFKVVD